MKGPTWLSCLRHFDVIKSVSPEYMHLALLGVSKLVLSLWLKESAAMHANRNVIEERIKHIEVPTEICREPRGISEVKHWKGKKVHENLCESIPVFTFYYSFRIQGMDFVLCSASASWDFGSQLFPTFCFVFRGTVVIAAINSVSGTYRTG